MSRAFAQQFGNAPLDNPRQHFVMDGIRMTKITHPNGYITFHRRIGNPYPLFATALGSTFVMLGVLNLDWRGLHGTAIWLTVALPLCGIGGLTSCCFAMLDGDTYLATAAGTLAGLIGGVSLVIIPATGIQGAFFIANHGNPVLTALALYKALSIVFFCSFVPCFILFLAALRTAIPVAFSTAILFTILLLTGASYVHYPQVLLTHIAGYLSLISGVLSLSSALAVLMAEEGIDVMPVMPMPNLD